MLEVFQTYSLPYMKQITDAISDKVPVTLFAKEAWHSTGNGQYKLLCGWTLLDAKSKIG